MDEREPVNVHFEWTVGRRSIARIRSFAVSIDNPEERGGEETGPTPTELLLASLGGCFAIDFVQFAEKMRAGLRGLRLSVSGLRERGENPRFTQINVSIHLEMERIDPQRVQRLSDLVLFISSSTY